MIVACFAIRTLSFVGETAKAATLGVRITNDMVTLFTSQPLFAARKGRKQVVLVQSADLN